MGLRNRERVEAKKTRSVALETPRENVNALELGQPVTLRQCGGIFRFVWFSVRQKTVNGGHFR